MNSFCRYLSNGYSFKLDKNSGISVRPCCLFATAIPLNSQLSQNRKLNFESIDHWTSNCAKCKTLEDFGQQSLRQTGSDWVPDDETSTDPVAVDINFDNECNAACIICNSHSSSLWEKEQAKLRNKKITINRDNDFIINSINQLVDTVSLKKLKYVKFFGGEPLFTDTHLAFIKHIPHPENVTLHYTTNGSIYPSEQTLLEWKKFKTIIFAASLDGIEEQFDYVRWPLPWSKVSKNLIRLKENKDIWNLMFRVEFTANVLNTYYYDRLETWVKSNLNTNAFGDPTEINIHPCWGPWDLNNMPMYIRSAVLKKYSTDHAIYKLVANLPLAPTLSESEPWKDFINTWDSRRNNSWKTAFPDLEVE